MTLFEAMVGSGSVRNMGEITLVVLGEGRGGLVTTTLEFSGVRKWADGRTATGVLYRDLNVFMERFDTCVARAGSSLQTKGHATNILRLAKAMRNAGLELSEWTFPPLVRDALKARSPQEEQDIMQEAPKKTVAPEETEEGGN